MEFDKGPAVDPAGQELSGESCGGSERAGTDAAGENRHDLPCGGKSLRCQRRSLLPKWQWRETGFGIWQEKVLKNMLGSIITWDSIKDTRTVGVIREDREKKTD